MDVFIEGSRTTDQGWLEAQHWPAGALPSLSEEQRRTAGQLGVSEESFARSLYATELSRPVLEERAERYGRALEVLLRRRFSDAEVSGITLRTLQGRLQVSALVKGQKITFEIDEDLIDNLTTSGSADLMARLQVVLDLNFAALESRTRAS